MSPACQRRRCCSDVSFSRAAVCASLFCTSCLCSIVVMYLRGVRRAARSAQMVASVTGPGMSLIVRRMCSSLCLSPVGARDSWYLCPRASATSWKACAVRSERRRDEKASSEFEWM
jgi:hypothetical protein